MDPKALQQIPRILRNNGDINAFIEISSTLQVRPLIHAIRWKDETLFDKIMLAKPNLRLPGGKGECKDLVPLQVIGLIRDDPELQRRMTVSLLNAGVDPNHCLSSWVPLMYYLLDSEDTPSIDLLVKRGADFDKIGYNGVTLITELVFLIAYHHSLVLKSEKTLDRARTKILIKDMTDVIKREKLIVAHLSRKIQVLLRHGANPRACGKSGVNSVAVVKEKQLPSRLLLLKQ